MADVARWQRDGGIDAATRDIDTWKPEDHINFWYDSSQFWMRTTWWLLALFALTFALLLWEYFKRGVSA